MRTSRDSTDVGGHGGRARARVVLGVLLALALTVLGLVAAGAVAGNAREASATVSLRSTKLGPALVAANGHTLYLFMKDRAGKSSCSGQCATYWPPLIAHGKLSAGKGVNASLLSTVRRSDGRMQVRYNRHPLYRFSQDTRAGQTSGQAVTFFGGTWYVVSSAGKAVVKPPSGTNTSPAPTTTTAPYPTTTNPYP